MPLRPLHDRVLIRRLEDNESKIGSIYIPDSAKEKPQRGEVVAVGSGRLLETGERVAPTSSPRPGAFRQIFRVGSEGGWSGCSDCREDEILAVFE